MKHFNVIMQFIFIAFRQVCRENITFILYWLLLKIIGYTCTENPKKWNTIQCSTIVLNTPYCEWPPLLLCRESSILAVQWDKNMKNNWKDTTFFELETLKYFTKIELIPLWKTCIHVLGVKIQQPSRLMEWP